MAFYFASIYGSSDACQIHSVAQFNFVSFSFSSSIEFQMNFFVGIIELASDVHSKQSHTATSEETGKAKITTHICTVHRALCTVYSVHFPKQPNFGRLLKMRVRATVALNKI